MIAGKENEINPGGYLASEVEAAIERPAAGMKVNEKIEATTF